MLWTWKKVSEGFEGKQDTFPQNSSLAVNVFGRINGEVDKRPSGFSSEDLMSDLVMFYGVVKEMSNDELLENGLVGRIPEIEVHFSQGVWAYAHDVRPEYEDWEPDFFSEGQIHASTTNRAIDGLMRVSVSSGNSSGDTSGSVHQKFQNSIRQLNQPKKASGCGNR